MTHSLAWVIIRTRADNTTWTSIHAISMYIFGFAHSKYNVDWVTVWQRHFCTREKAYIVLFTPARPRVSIYLLKKAWGQSPTGEKRSYRIIRQGRFPHIGSRSSSPKAPPPPPRAWNLWARVIGLSCEAMFSNGCGRLF